MQEAYAVKLKKIICFLNIIFSLFVILLPTPRFSSETVKKKNNDPKKNQNLLPSSPHQKSKLNAVRMAQQHALAQEAQVRVRTTAMQMVDSVLSKFFVIFSSLPPAKMLKCQQNKKENR